MAFCTNCGEQLKDGAKFCHSCGTPINYASTEGQPRRENEYAGKIIKCPNCGENLASFQLKCPSCGHEIREYHVSSVVKEFSAKLEAIDAEPEPEQKGLFRKRKNPNELSAKEQKKIFLIRSFPIPNTREDLFEFLVLASSNVNTTHVDISVSEEALSDAWNAKYEQAYKKAKLSFGDSPEFRELSKEHTSKTKKHAQKKALIAAGCIIAFALFAVLTIIGLVYIGIDQANVDAEVAAENARLEAILDEINDYIAAEDYVTAKALTTKLVFTISDNLLSVKNARENWDQIREELYVIIDNAESTISNNSASNTPDP